MPMIPPTPFLPSSKYHSHDRTLLLDAHVDFDDESFASWPSTPGRGLSVDEFRETNETAIHGQPATVMVTDHGVLAQSTSQAGKRIGEETPLGVHENKRVRTPVPHADDLYSRRVQDSDRRASLGPRELEIPLSHSAFGLSRSMSRSSMRSSTSGRSLIVPREPAVLPLKGCPPPLSAAPGRSVRTDIDATPPSLPALSPASQSPSTPIASWSDSDLPHDPLHRSISQLSTASTSRRASIANKVSGFFSRIVKRRSSTAAGGNEAEEHGSVTDCGAEQSISMEPGEGEVGRGRDTELATTDLEAEGQRVDGQEAEPSAASDPGGKPTALGIQAVARTMLGAPRLRLPPALTRPAPRELTTAARALQPKRVVHAPVKPQLPKTGTDKPAGRAVAHAQRPKATSSFTARALSRLPAPGKGSTSSSRPTEVRAAERAHDLAVRREKFERLARAAEEERARTLSRYTTIPPRQMNRTSPIRGNTPGKASRARAEERARFEQGLRERHDEKEKRDKELQDARANLEREEQRVRRLDTVVWARELPDAYRTTGPKQQMAEDM